MKYDHLVMGASQEAFVVKGIDIALYVSLFSKTDAVIMQYWHRVHLSGGIIGF